MDFVKIVQDSLAAVESGNTKLPRDFPDEKAEHSLSGYKGRQLINTICEHPGIKYLEVGSYAGSTLCSALYKNKIEATACDVWELFIEQPRATIVENLFKERVKTHLGGNSVNVVKSDVYNPETAKLIGGGHNFYFFDGDHTTIATQMGIMSVMPCLEKRFIMMIDDYAMVTTRQGVKEAIEELGLVVEFSTELGTLEPYDWYTQNPRRMRGEDDWWCNYYIAVIRKP